MMLLALSAVDLLFGHTQRYVDREGEDYGLSIMNMLPVFAYWQLVIIKTTLIMLSLPTEGQISNSKAILDIYNFLCGLYIFKCV